MLENLGYYLIEWDGVSNSIELSEEEYAKLNASTIPLLVADGIFLCPSTFFPGFSVVFQMNTGNSSFMVSINLMSPPVLEFVTNEITIPSYTSDLENDSNFVSSDGLKTINGESLIGSGDIAISGESSNARKEIVYAGGLIDHVITAMRPNVVYWLENIKNVTIDSFEAPLQGVDSYDIFTVVMSLDSQMSNAYDVSLTLPDNILWANGQIPDLKEGEFELSISRISDGDLSYYYAVLTPFK